MMAMPVVMLVLCYGMPSGLTLYWTVQTLMTILQYKLSNTSAPLSTAATTKA
jgi:membrane protein insertase Oxa1/YidC/SpoIIIJ